MENERVTMENERVTMENERVTMENESARHLKIRVCSLFILSLFSVDLFANYYIMCIFTGGIFYKLFLS